MKARQSGFTLIEVLVAITLMALVSIIAWRGLENVSSQQRRLTEDADENDTVIRMLGQFERDVALRAPDALLASGVNGLNAATGGDGTATGAGTNTGANTGMSTGTTNGGGTPTGTSTGTSGTGTGSGVGNTAVNGVPPSLLPQSILVTTSGQPDGPARVEMIRSDAANPGAWQRVVWFQDGTLLRRAVGASARRYPLPPVGPAAVILTGVYRFTVRGWLPGNGWVTTPFPTTGTPFTGLELSVQRLPADGRERYARVVILE
jgi:general secretion pathway protein J